MTGRRRVVVVGGGVAGLAAARRLASRHETVLLERDGRLGGRLRTEQFRGRPVDVGPDSFITRNDAAERLCRELGLAAELIEPATTSAGVLARGRVRPLPSGLVLGVSTDIAALARSGVVGPLAALRAAADLVLPRSAATAALAAEDGGADPTVAEVIRPRLGRAVLEVLVDPLLGGINAGDSSRLSFTAAAPMLAASVAGKRSLILSLRRRPRSVPELPGPRKPAFLGLSDGIETLATRLGEECLRLGVDVRTGSAAEWLRLRPAGREPRWELGLGGAVLEADALVLALPAPDSARLLEASDARLAAECAAIPYAGVVTVTLAWPMGSVPKAVSALPMSGVLVPRSARNVVTAVSFTSRKWPRSANTGELVLRVSTGRDGDGRAISLDDHDLVERVRAELASMLGIVAEPAEVLVARYPAALPQYLSGHRARVARIEEASARLPALALAGAAYGGIGIPSCISSGERAAASVEGALAR